MCSINDDKTTGLLDTGWKSRFNAWFFDTFHVYINFITSKHKRKAFADIPAGIVLELGAGTGANFQWLPCGCQLLALEPNKAMHQRLIINAHAAGIEMELLHAPAETIPLTDNSVDTVIASLVLCTVKDPQRVLTEVRRVLRPGGTFRFVEHVAAHPASPRRWLQLFVAKPWAWLFEGCDTNRNTVKILRHTRFSKMIYGTCRLRKSVFIPVNSAIWGIATG